MLALNDSGIDTIHEGLAEFSEDIATVLSSVSNEKRLQIVQLLSVSERTFSEMQQITELSKTALVHHLNKLVESDMVVHVDRGRYELSKDGSSLLNAILGAYQNSERFEKIVAARRMEYIERVHSKKPSKDLEGPEISVTELPPMKVASVCVISKSPENDAWEKMRNWANTRNLLDDPENHPVFGFNNPNPSPEREEYGYEFWMRVPPDFETDEIMEKEGIVLKDVEGGMYALTVCHLKQEMESDFFKNNGYLPGWRRLLDWIADSIEYKMDKRPGLERAHDPDATIEELRLDLLMPIRKIRR